MKQKVKLVKRMVEIIKRIEKEDSISENNKKNNKLDSVDILKGIAIIMIIFVHSTQKFSDTNIILKNISRFGQLGCQLFFLISGFTLCLSYSNKKDKNIWKFYKSRFINVAPGYYFIMILYFLLNTILIDILKVETAFETRREFSAILINVLFLNGLFRPYNNNVVPGGWYIGTSMVFYLIFPLIYQISSKLENKNKKLLYAFPYIMTVISMVIQIFIGKFMGITNYPMNNSFEYFYIVNQLPVMLLGVVLFFKYKNNELKKYDNKVIILKIIIWLVITCILFYGEIPVAFSIIPISSAKMFFWIFVFLNTNIDKNRNKRVLINCGKVSY